MPNSPRLRHLCEALKDIPISYAGANPRRGRRPPPISSDLESAVNLLSSPLLRSPPVSIFNKLINSFILTNQLSAALALSSDLRNSHLPLTNPSFSILLKLQSLLKADHRSLYTIIAMMLKSGCKPDAVTHATLISGLCRAGHLQEALGVIDHMLGDDPCLLTVRCYTPLVLAWCKSGRVDLAEELMDLMSRYGCPPDDVTNTILIARLCRMEKFGEVERVLGESGSKGWKPSEVTYNVYMNGLCKAGRVADACSLLGVMRWRGLRLTLEARHILFNCAYRFSDSSTLRQLMCLLECEVDAYFYNTLMSRLYEIGRYGDVHKLLASMLMRGVEIDTCTCTILIRSLCKENKLLEAIYCFDRLSFEADVVAFNTLLHGFYMAKMFEGVYKLFCEYVNTAATVNALDQKIKITPNEFTYGIVIDSLCREGEFPEAVNCYINSIKNGFFLGLIARPIRWLIKDGKLKEVVRLFEEMLGRGFVLQDFVFSTLIRALCEKRLCRSEESGTFSLFFDKMLGIK